jgi:uncharacterized protein YciW
VARLREQRPDFVRHTEGSHAAMITPADPGSVSLAERAAVALEVAERTPDAVLAAHYRSLLEAAGPADSPRLPAMRRHAALLATAPGQATRADLEALLAAGLSPKDVVTISQIIAFVAYQARVAVGMRLLAGEAA